MNQKVKICNECNGYEPCLLEEMAYYPHKEKGLCVWKYTIMKDKQKASRGIEELTFPDVRDLE